MTFSRLPKAARLLVAALALGLVSAGAVSAKSGLSENVYINERLIAARIGDVIRKTCPTISARIFYALSEGKKLERYALDLGYTKDEIKAFTSSEVEKKRVKDAADAYMAANGVVEGDTESYCVLGRKEIENKTITGSLLKAH